MTYKEFTKEATTKQMYDYMQFCFRNNYKIDDESTQRFITYSNWDHKVTLVAKSLCIDNRLTETYHLVKWVIELRDELISFGNSEGLDTETELVKQVNLWIKENIDNENPN